MKDNLKHQFWFSQKHKDSRRGMTRRVQFKDGCRYVPYCEQFAKLEDGRIVEFTVLCPTKEMSPDYDFTKTPRFAMFDDFVLLGEGSFYRNGKEL